MCRFGERRWKKSVRGSRRRSTDRQIASFSVSGDHRDEPISSSQAPLTGHRTRATWFCAFAVGIASSWGAQPPARVAAAEQHHERPLPADFNEPIRLYTVGLGKFTRPISSTNAEAQAYFNQGFQLMYAFAKPEAVRSFREAAKARPGMRDLLLGRSLGMGVVHQRGHGRRSRRRSRTPRFRRPLALADAHASRRRSRRSSRRWRSVTSSTSIRPHARSGPRLRRRDGPRRRGLSGRPRRRHALRRGVVSPRAAPRRRSTSTIRTSRACFGVLERALKATSVIPAPVISTSTRPSRRPSLRRAAPCAEFLGNSIPGASHINHMPSHTWTRVGRWGDAVRASLQAWHSDLKAASGEGFATYPAHDLQMLAFAASMDGQGAIAIQAGRGLANLTKRLDVSRAHANPVRPLRRNLWYR